MTCSDHALSYPPMSIVDVWHATGSVRMMPIRRANVAHALIGEVPGYSAGWPRCPVDTVSFQRKLLV